MADVIDVFVNPGVSIASVAATINHDLGPAYGLSPDTRTQFIDRLTAIVSSLQRLIGSVQVVAVLVATLGVANTLLIATFERRRDVGVLGVVLAWGMGTGVGLFAHRITEIQTGLAIPIIIQPLAYLAVLGLGVAASVGAALYPAQRAATLDVTEALQYE